MKIILLFNEYLFFVESFLHLIQLEWNIIIETVHE